MNSKFLFCIFAVLMCSIVQEASGQYYGYSSYYPSYYGGYGLGAYNGYYGGYGYGNGYGNGYGWYGKRQAGFDPSQKNNN